MKKMNKKELFEKMVEMGVNEEVMEVLKGYFKEKERGVSDNSKRMNEVLDLLRRNKEEGISVESMGEIIGISNKNVSSYLSYLRKKGYKIWSFEGGSIWMKGKRNKINGKGWWVGL